MQWVRVRIRVRARDRVRARAKERVRVRVSVKVTVRVSVSCAFSETFVGIAAVGIAACTRLCTATQFGRPYTKTLRYVSN